MHRKIVATNRRFIVKWSYLQNLSRILMSKTDTSLYNTILETPLGQMIAVADTEFLYLLEFSDKKGLERELEQIERRFIRKILSGKTEPIESIQLELEQYFKGTLQN